MSGEAEIAAMIVEALVRATATEAGVAAPLVSVSIEMVALGEASSVQTSVERKTRTLVFMSAEALSSDGARIASATSVHKIGTTS